MFILLVPGLGLVSVLGGCHTPPQLEVAAEQARAHTEDGYALEFVLFATNPNPFELPLLTIDYELWLDGERVFEGRRWGEATLRREGTQTLRLPAAVPVAPGAPGGAEGAAPGRVATYRLRGQMRYLTPGALAQSLFDARLSRPSVGFDARGEVDLSPDGG